MYLADPVKECMHLIWLWAHFKEQKSVLTIAMVLARQCLDLQFYKNGQKRHF